MQTNPGLDGQLLGVERERSGSYKFEFGAAAAEDARTRPER